jgi:hypothetical protein
LNFSSRSARLLLSESVSMRSYVGYVTVELTRSALAALSSSGRAGRSSSLGRSSRDSACGGSLYSNSQAGGPDRFIGLRGRNSCCSEYSVRSFGSCQRLTSTPEAAIELTSGAWGMMAFAALPVLAAVRLYAAQVVTCAGRALGRCGR